MRNDQLREALRIWVRANKFERYQFPIISNRVKQIAAWILIGTFGGFVVGFVIGVLSKG